MTRFLPLLAVIMSLSGPVWAQETSSDYEGDRTNRIVFGGGLYNVIDDGAKDPVDTFRLEARLGEIPVWKFHPWLGIEVVDAEFGWIGAGLESDIELTDWLVLTLQTGVGYFDDGGHGGDDDLERPYNPESGFEFRHQVELAVKTENDWRIGVGFSHMSNLGIGDTFNPGIESVTLNVHMPTDAILGK